MKKRRLISMVSVLLVIVMLALASGCQNTAKPVEGEDVSPTDQPNSEDIPSSYISEEKITLKLLTTEWNNVQVGSDMPVYQELEKRTNIHLDIQLLPLTDPEEKFNLIMAGGDLPDIVGYANNNALLKYGMEGAFIPLQDLIKELGPDIVKALDDPLPNDKLPYTQNNWAEITASNGNIYSVPLISSSNAIGAVYAIRTDWLEKLDLEVPETAEELYQVLKAFKERDPNENGEADELPLVAGQGGKTPTILPLVNAFDAHMDLYIDENDEIKYGPVEENYKEGLMFLNRLYSEGLLEEDYLTATNDQFLARATGNKAGFMFAWPASGIGGATAGLQKLDPSYKFMPMAPLKSTSGARYKDTATAGRFLQPRNAITIANKYPEETMKLFNYIFTDEGTTLVSYGIEGEHYTMVDGKPKYTDLILNNPDGLDSELARVKDGLMITSLPYQIGWDCNFQAQQNAPWTTETWELYREPGMVEMPFPTLSFSDAELAKKNQITAEINTYKDAMIDKFIMGIEPFEKFDEFIANINRAGLPEMLEISNAAYSKYKEFGAQ